VRGQGGQRVWPLRLTVLVGSVLAVWPSLEVRSRAREADDDPKVSALAYIAAFALDAAGRPAEMALHESEQRLRLAQLLTGIGRTLGAPVEIDRACR
jgi:hypothetical protein